MAFVRPGDGEVEAEGETEALGLTEALVLLLGETEGEAEAEGDTEGEPATDAKQAAMTVAESLLHVQKLPLAGCVPDVVVTCRSPSDERAPWSFSKVRVP